MTRLNIFGKKKPKSRFDRYHLTSRNQTSDEVYELSFKRCLLGSIVILLIIVVATFGLEQLTPTIDRSY